MASRKKTARKKVRLPFIVAGVVALVGFGVVSGIAFDVATRPAPRPRPVIANSTHPSRQVPPPHVVAPVESGSIFDGKGDPRRAWGSEGGADQAETADPKAQTGKEPPLVAFAVPATAAPHHPVLAIVIDDMGVDHTHALRTMELPGPLTLSLMTYAPDLPDLVSRAHAAGHEVMAHLPMEPISPKENPGPGALLAKMDDAAIRRQIAADLDGWSGYVGINNHMGSKFTSDKGRMIVVMEELKARGLMYLDSRTTGDSAGLAAAAQVGVPSIARDTFIDNEEKVPAIIAQLEKAKATAKSRGAALAIGHPHDTTIAALKQWLPGLAAEGVTLVPATEILRREAAEHRSD